MIDKKSVQGIEAVAFFKRQGTKKAESEVTTASSGNGSKTLAKPPSSMMAFMKNNQAGPKEAVTPFIF